MPRIAEDTRDLIHEHERLVRVLRSPSHADDLREAQRQAQELREYRQKERVKNWPLKKPAPQGRPAVALGDELYFQHPQRGPTSGKVLCHGAHGVTLECTQGQRHQVRWDRLLGAKQRLAQDFAMVEQGEDGAVLEDAQGQRRFLQWPALAARDENEDEKAEAPLKKAVFFFKPRRFKGQPGYQLQAHRYHSILPAGDSGGKGSASAPIPPILPSSGSITTFTEAHTYYQTHLAGKTTSLSVQLKSGHYPLTVYFSADNAHAYTHKTQPHETPDVWDNPRAARGPRTFDINRAQLLDRLIPTVQHPWKLLGDRGSDLYFSQKLNDGQHYVVVLTVKQAGHAELAAAYSMNAADVDKKLHQLRPVLPAGQKKNPLRKAEGFSQNNPQFVGVGGICSHQDPKAPRCPPQGYAARATIRVPTDADLVKPVPTLQKAQPTPAQINAGNYKKQHVRFQGLDISIEKPKGSVRSGTDPDGKPWRTVMHHPYGYIRGSKGVDKDHVDCYLGPHEDADMAYIIHQRKAGQWDRFDEDKVMLGFRSKTAACRAYLAQYDDPRFLGPITSMPMEEFKIKVLATAHRPRMIKGRVLFFTASGRPRVPA